jgi:trehalose utilization protein
MVDTQESYGEHFDASQPKNKYLQRIAVGEVFYSLSYRERGHIFYFNPVDHA